MPALLPSSGWTAPLVGFSCGAMAFLAVLALAASLAASGLAAEWRSDLADVSTVRLSAEAAGKPDTVAAVLEVLRTTPGIADVRVLTEEEQAALITPWLGTGEILAELPMPQLIDVTLRGDGPDVDALQARLDLTVQGATYDDHAAWRGPLAKAADSLEVLAIIAVVVTLLTVGCLVAFAARATLIGNRSIVETLRLIGAEDSFIARAFVGRLVRRAAIGSLIGTAFGCLCLWALPNIDAEDPALTVTAQPGALGWFILLFVVPAFAVLITWLAARGAVRLTLRRLP